MRKPRVVSIAPGADFLGTLVEALFDGRLIAGFEGRRCSAQLGSATIYVPTRRAAQALSDVFVDRVGLGAVLLPRIVPLALTDDPELSILLGEASAPDAAGTDIAASVGELERRLLLSELVLAWAHSIERAIVSVGTDGRHSLHATEALLVGTRPADALHLAGELADLIDELHIEGVEWGALKPLGAGAHDEYWRITLHFLDIAMCAWPKILAERGLMEAVGRRVLLLEREARRLQGGCAGGPIIVAGSTGTNRATAALMATVARCPQGAVVLPGLDLELDETAWNGIGRDTAAGHPQAALRRLLPRLGVARSEVGELGRPAASLAMRNTFLREALRPAATTAMWQSRAARLGDADMAAALTGVSIIEAPDERAEALALALVLREALEEPGRTAALITPDRGLARRVAAELRRWDIEAQDSAGTPLARCPAGVLARLAGACAAGGAKPVDVAALLAHPLARLGYPRAELERLAEALEVGVLRTAAARLNGVAAQLAAAREAAGDRHAHPAVTAIAPETWVALEALMSALEEAVAPMAAVAAGKATLRTWIEAHRAAVLALAQDPASGLPAGRDAEALLDLFEEAAAASTEGLRFGADDYCALFDRLAALTPVREAETVHPRLKILGLLEARLLSFDVVALGGLDETIWPPQATTDAFLNRPMREELGLSPPERRIGQTAHDFVQALGARRAVLSRALKRGGAPTVASRLLQRMQAVAGAELWARCLAGGARYLTWAQALEHAATVTPVRAPEPRPKAELRPRSLSVTAIETLRRDPYSIYAERILKLVPLDPIGAEEGPREFGTRLHRVLSEFAERRPTDLPLTVEHELAELAHAVFADALADADFRAVQWPRIQRSLAFYLKWERDRRPDIARIFCEVGGTLAFPLASGATFRLTGKADRIELGADGRLTVVDYKTGSPPSAKAVAVGFAPQLTLEAAMASRGAFRGIAAGTQVGDGIYVKLGSRGVGGEAKPLAWTDGSTFAGLAENHLAELSTLLEAFERIETPYLSRPFPQYALQFGTYDHLARVREWATGEAPGEDGA